MIRINLLKPEGKDFKQGVYPVSEEAKDKKKTEYSMFAIILSVFLCTALFFTQKNSSKKESALLQNAQDQKQRLLYVFSKLEELEQQKALYEKKINLIRQLKSKQGSSVRVMDGLSENIPSAVWLTQSSFDKSSVQIKGLAFSNSSIADYLSYLEINPYFDEVNLIASIQKRIRNNDVHEFSMTANYTFDLIQEPEKSAENASNGMNK